MPPGSLIPGGISCHANFAVVNFAAGNFAEATGLCVVNFANTPRNVVACSILRGRWRLAAGATHYTGETHPPHSASDEGPVGLRS